MLEYGGAHEPQDLVGGKSLLLPLWSRKLLQRNSAQRTMFCNKKFLCFSRMKNNCSPSIAKLSERSSTGVVEALLDELRSMRFVLWDMQSGFLVASQSTLHHGMRR